LKEGADISIDPYDREERKLDMAFLSVLSHSAAPLVVRAVSRPLAGGLTLRCRMARFYFAFTKTWTKKRAVTQD